MLPSIFGENLFDDMFDDAFSLMPSFGTRDPLYGKHAKNLMKTDVRETDTGYEIDVDLPGFKKDEVQVQVNNGYLTISTQKALEKDEKNKKGRMLRQERYAGMMQRSFYVGDQVTGQEISAKFEDGILKIHLPKAAPQLPAQKGLIAIE